MRRVWMTVAVLTVAATLGNAKPKVKPSVHYAASWEAAIAEGKLLNLPVVVHCHGFG